MLQAFKNKSFLPFGAVLGAAFLIILFHFFHIVDFHESDAIDLRFRLRGTQKADPGLTIVTIDDESLSALGQWPWPRSVHATFLDIISRYQPRAVFFDVLFTEASRAAEDEAFAAAVKRSGTVVLPF